MRLSWASEMSRSICFKYDHEGIFVVVAATFSSKITVEGDKEACNCQEGHDKDKIWIAIERITNEIWMATVSCVRWRPKLAGSMETAGFPWKLEGSFRRRWGSGVAAEGKEKYMANELQRNHEKGTRSSCFGQRTKSSKKCW